jgi:ribosomal protein L37AE/L43A
VPLVEIRFADNGGEPFCPHCGVAKVYTLAETPIRWKCSGCRRKFSATEHGREFAASHFVPKGMKTENEWADDVKRLLRAEMTRRGVTYGVTYEDLLKIFRKSLVQALAALGARSLRISEDTNGE